MINKKRPVIRQLAAAAGLSLCWGCATLETVSPEAPEAVLLPIPVAEAEPVPVEEPAEEVAEIEPRVPIKDLLLEDEAASDLQQKAQSYTVRRGDTLGAIALKHQVPLSGLKRANGLEKDRILVGQKLIIPTQTLRLQIDKSDNELTVFSGERLIRAYPVATGDQGITPAGSYTIANRLIGATWYWQGHAVTPDDPDYPLGSRWLGLSKRGYGIHGTNEPELIGQQVSHGCIRMHNEDVEELFDVVSIGTAVTIIE